MLFALATLLSQISPAAAAPDRSQWKEDLVVAYAYGYTECEETYTVVWAAEDLTHTVGAPDRANSGYLFSYSYNFCANDYTSMWGGSLVDLTMNRPGTFDAVADIYDAFTGENSSVSISVSVSKDHTDRGVSNYVQSWPGGSLRVHFQGTQTDGAATFTVNGVNIDGAEGFYFKASESELYFTHP